MHTEYSDLSSLESAREKLKKEVREKEDILRFNHPKKSFGVLTKGFTDHFFPRDQAEDTGRRRHHDSNRIGIAAAVDRKVRTELVRTVGDFARKNLDSKSWKRKLIGVGVVYLLPIVLKKGIEFIEDQLDESQL